MTKLFQARIRPSAKVIDCDTVYTGLTDEDIPQAPYTLETVRLPIARYGWVFDLIAFRKSL